MLKHIQKEHQERPHEVKFEWGVLSKFPKALERQLSEALFIENTPVE